MSKIISVCGLVLALVLLNGCGGEGSRSATKGAATPEEAVKRLVEAIKQKDADDLAAMISTPTHTPEAMADMMLALFSVNEPIQQAKTKYGEKELGEAFGFGMLFLAMFDPQLDDLATKGQINYSQDKKSAQVVVKEEGEQGKSQSSNISLVMGDDGRWYLGGGEQEIPAGVDVGKFVAEAHKFRDGLIQAVKDCADAEAFAEAFGPRFQEFGKAMQALTPQE